MNFYLKLNKGAHENLMEYIKQIFQHANSYGSKSSILSILLWIIFGVIGPMILASIFAPIWISILLAVILVFFLGIFAYTYLRCLHTGDTDSLRSEKFVISKMAIEKQVSGDSLTGSQLTLPSNVGSKVVATVSEDDQE